MTMRSTIACGLPLLFVASGAAAQIRIDQQRPAPRNGTVCVSSQFGSIEIVGSDGDVVVVQGTLAAGADDFSIDGDDDGISVGVSTPEEWLYSSTDDTDYRSTLTVRVPRGSSVCADTLNAAVRVRDVAGAVEIATVNGTVSVEGDPRSVEVETMTGPVVVRARAAAMAVESLSGDVDLEGATGQVEVETVSGKVRVGGKGVSEVAIETTSGEVALDADFASSGQVEIRTHSGGVRLTLAEAAKARFELTTFSGTITSPIGPKPSRRGAFLPETRLRFSTGSDEFEVSVETFEGPIVVERRGASQ